MPGELTTGENVVPVTIVAVVAAAVFVALVVLDDTVLVVTTVVVPVTDTVGGGIGLDMITFCPTTGVFTAGVNVTLVPMMVADMEAPVDPGVVSVIIAVG